MRKKIVAGNWKMNLRIRDAFKLGRDVVSAVLPEDVSVVVCPPMVHLYGVQNIIGGRANLHLGAQNCHHLDSGAYTGEVSAAMIQSVGVEYIIVGHSERREYAKETNAQIAQKVNKVIEHDMTPIFCCGEPLQIRDKETHVRYVARQLREGLFHLPPHHFDRVVIAYEPIWAIGTGRTASPEQAQEMHAAIRDLVKKQYGIYKAEAVSILYGGSCNAENAKTLFALPDVDGGLIGGASLKSADFLTIVRSF